VFRYSIFCTLQQIVRLTTKQQLKLNMKIKITFEDIFDNVESEEQAYDVLLEYLNDCVKHEDVTGFNFEKIEE
jgi:hypothetical protein